MIDSELRNAIVSERWDEVMSLLIPSETHNIINTIDRISGRNILHSACFYRAPPNVMNAILSLCDSTTMTAQEKYEKRTPLHEAICRLLPSSLSSSSSPSSPSDEIIEAIIDACPHAASMADAYEVYPLHDAISFGRSVRVINRLVMAHPSIVMKEDLWLLFQGWNIAIREALDDAAERRASLDVSTCLLVRDNERSIGWVVDVATLLLKAYVSCTNNLPLMLSQDHKGGECSFRPLYAAIAVSICPWSFFRAMLDTRFQEDALKSDGNGNYPLHVAVTTDITSSDGDLYQCFNCNCHFKNSSWYQYRIVFCQTCLIRGVVGDIDDYSVISPVKKTPAVIADLLSANMAMASIPNTEGRLPLSLAIENGLPFQEGRRESGNRRGDTKLIFEACPTALMTRDIKTHLYPFQLAATKKSTIMTMIYEDKTTSDDTSTEQFSWLSSFGSCYAMLMECPSLLRLDLDKMISRDKRKRKRCMVKR